MGIIFGFQKFLFFEAGENLTFDVRCLLFESLIYKQISWFDRKDKAPGILSNLLSEDITNLNGLTTETMGTLLESFFCLTIGCAISGFFEWRMTIVCIVATPFVMIGGIIMSRLQWKASAGKRGFNQEENQKKKDDPYEQSNALLSDVILNYRTVISFGQRNVDTIMSNYEKLLESPASVRVRNAHIAGLAYGYSLCVRFIFIGTIFWIASNFIIE